MRAIRALPTKRIEPWFRSLVILSTCLILVGAYFAGIARGLDSYLGYYTLGPFVLGVCATATKWLTGLGDYVCLQPIFNWQGGIMQDLGFRVTPSDWLFNREFIDHALQQLFAHPHWTIPHTNSLPAGVGDIGWGMDEGYAKFVELAFYLFGPKLGALYRTYWLVFGISAAAYLVAYRRTLAPLLVLLVFAVIQYMIFSTSIFWFTEGLPHSITDPGCPRFLSILCVIPALHLLAAARSDRPWRWTDLALIVVQGFVLGLALLQRMTVQWVILAFVVLAAGYWLWRWRFSPTAPKRRYWAAAAFALLFGVATHLYSDFVRYPGLAELGSVPHHNVWFTIVEKLSYNPNWKVRYAAEYDNKTDDEMAALFCRRYLANHKEEWPRWNRSNGDPYTVGMSSVGMEDLCRKAFFEFFRKDPKFVLADFFIYGTQRAAVMGADMAAQYVHWLWGIPFAFLIAIGAIAGLIGTRRDLHSTLVYVPLTLYLTAMAVAPNWLTNLTDLTMTDYFVMIAITMGVAIVAVGAGLAAVSLGKLGVSLGQPTIEPVS